MQAEIDELEEDGRTPEGSLGVADERGTGSGLQGEVADTDPGFPGFASE